MPASSTGALNSWGLYLIAAAALLLVLVPVLTSTAMSSREGADWRNVDGLRAVIDSLRPGVTVEYHYGASASGDPIHLGGRSVSCSYGGGTVSLRTRWPLPDVTISPTAAYDLRLVGGTAEVVQIG
ncbi:MAG: hypothetical protein KGI38_03055 [Thaumarchaeota archaeon]|nr:hypothetical protein [Nitrososphaerota archaeon]